MPLRRTPHPPARLSLTFAVFRKKLLLPVLGAGAEGEAEVEVEVEVNSVSSQGYTQECNPTVESENASRGIDRCPKRL
jgi:hypothetical protein